MNGAELECTNQIQPALWLTNGLAAAIFYTYLKHSANLATSDKRAMDVNERKLCEDDTIPLGSSVHNDEIEMPMCH